MSRKRRNRGQKGRRNQRSRSQPTNSHGWRKSDRRGRKEPRNSRGRKGRIRRTLRRRRPIGRVRPKQRQRARKQQRQIPKDARMRRIDKARFNEARRQTPNDIGAFRNAKLRWYAVVARKLWHRGGGVLAVAWLIADLWNASKGYAWPTADHLAEQLGANPKTILRAVELLEKHDCLVVDRSRRRGNRYVPDLKIIPTELESQAADLAGKGIGPSERTSDIPQKGQPVIHPGGDDPSKILVRESIEEDRARGKDRNEGAPPTRATDGIQKREGKSTGRSSTTVIERMNRSADADDVRSVAERKEVQKGLADLVAGIEKRK